MRLLLAAAALSLVLAACSRDERRDLPIDYDAESIDGPRSAESDPVDRSPVLPSNGNLPVDAPAFMVTTLAGETFDLADRRGDVILVNFWATWCAPCVIEVPDLVKIQADYGSQGLVVLGVSVDEDDEPAVRTFASDFGINYPIAIDLQVGDAFGGIYGLPTTFVIDREGRIVHRIVGLFPTESMIPEIERLLQESA